MDSKLIARVATASFEFDLSRAAIRLLDALNLPKLRSTMRAVDSELAAGGLGGPLIIESLANILAVRLIRHIVGLRRLGARTDGGLSRRKLKTVVDYDMANLNGSPTLKEMPALVNLSPYHFTRQFKAATGLPPHPFVITRSVELAQQLLRGRGGLSLAEVAIGFGFTDQSQLRFHFKRIVGVAPGQFRASAKSTRREHVPSRPWVEIYLAYSSIRRGIASSLRNRIRTSMLSYLDSLNVSRLIKAYEGKGNMFQWYYDRTHRSTSLGHHFINHLN